MKRRVFIAGMAAGMAAPSFAAAQQIGSRGVKIGWLQPGTAPQVTPTVTAFERGLSDRGYVKDKTVSIEYVFKPPVLDDLITAAASLSDRVDLMVTWGTIGAVAAKRARVKRPVVFASVGFPVQIGLVQALRQPGTNFTGITFEAAEDTYAKRLQILKEVMPGATRVATVGQSEDPNVGPALDAAHSVARSLGVTLLDFGVRTVGDLPAAFTRMSSDGIQALLVIAGAFVWVHRDRIAELALANRLPSVHGLREGVAAGGLVSLGPDLVVMAGQAAGLVDKILRGAQPGELPVEQPARYELHINLRTARALGLTIPPSLLLRADQVIE